MYLWSNVLCLAFNVEYHEHLIPATLNTFAFVTTQAILSFFTASYHANHGNYSYETPSIINWSHALPIVHGYIDKGCGKN